MYAINTKPYGFELIFSGFISPDEMKQWVLESKQKVAAGKKFGVLVDMRNLKLLSPESQKIMEEGQKHFKMSGLERSAVILNSATLTMQFKRIATETGIYSFERYIDASKYPDNCQQIAESWITKGTDPDK